MHPVPPSNRCHACTPPRCSAAPSLRAAGRARDEPFFVDLHVFDLLGVGGSPTTDGVNVMSLVLEVPITEITRNSRPAAGSTGQNSVVGVWARAKRPIVTVRTPYGYDANFGGFQQVSRLGWPLVNEVVIPLQDKDLFNRSVPSDDVATPATRSSAGDLGSLPATPTAAAAPTRVPSRRTLLGAARSPHGGSPL